MQHFLYFLPLLHGQSSFLPILSFIYFLGITPASAAFGAAEGGGTSPLD